MRLVVGSRHRVIHPQNIAGHSVGIGHHLDIVVAVGHKAEAICCGDGVDGVVVASHCDDVY